MAAFYAALADHDRAFAVLEKLRDDRFIMFTTLKVDPAFDGLRPDPRFAALVRSMGLAP